jgi:hypothetical protein
MHVLGLTDLHSCRLQPIVDVINFVVRILHEANVKPLRTVVTDFYEGQ